MIHAAAAILLLIVMVAGIIAANVYCRRHPMTPEDEQDLEEQRQLW